MMILVVTLPFYRLLHVLPLYKFYLNKLISYLILPILLKSFRLFIFPLLLLYSTSNSLLIINPLLTTYICNPNSINILSTSPLPNTLLLLSPLINILNIDMNIQSICGIMINYCNIFLFCRILLFCRNNYINFTKHDFI